MEDFIQSNEEMLEIISLQELSDNEKLKAIQAKNTPRSKMKNI